MTPPRHATEAAAHAKAPPPAVPPDVAAALADDETIQAHFPLDEGLDIYATDRRFFGRREGRTIDVWYAEVADARRRTADRRSWHGRLRIALGVVFVAAGLLTGFATGLEAAVALALLIMGAGLVLLGLYRREDWVELRIDRNEPAPSFWYVVLFLPFWTMLRNRKRYRAPGSPAQVDAFHAFLVARLPARRAAP